LYRSIPLPEKPKLNHDDVTVIVPTIESNVEELRIPLRSILATEPYELILVTTFDKYHNLLQFASSLKDDRVKVYDTKIANKRIQLREAIPRVHTQVTILVDDDVTWPSTILPWILAPFEQPEIGSVGTCQRVKRIRTGSIMTRCWNWLGADYIERRNFEISASHCIDGGTSCMSGRTNAVRTEILKNPLFLDGFCQERWGKYHLNADDDNFLTRWLVNHNWKTWIQFEPECEIETTLENNFSFVRQCLRWARSNWRSNFTTLFIEKKVYAYVSPSYSLGYS
jgi:cellulose synthase/poly-beta-1,6-N-acetylglucosamine synthase-like glycosyltransferase